MKPSLLRLAVTAGLLGYSPATRAAFPEDGPAPTSAAPSAPVAAENAPVTVPPPSERAVRYHRSGNLIWGIEQGLAIALPLLLLFTGLSSRLRTVASHLAGGRFYPTLVIYLILLAVLLFLVELPLSYYVGFAREHAYGLSAQKLTKWISDQLKGLGVGLIVGALVLWVPYWLLARSPQRWWLWTGLLALPFYLLTLVVVPLWIAPLFNKFGPMKDQALEATVLETARAGRRRRRARLRGGEERRHQEGQRLRHRRRPDQAHRPVGHAAREAQARPRPATWSATSSATTSWATSGPASFSRRR